MSELNLLNASASDPLNPNFNWSGEYADNVSRFKARRGPVFSRLDRVEGITVGLQWLNRPLATMARLRQWYQQYKLGFFTVADYETGRYYSGHFVGPFKFTPVGFERWNIELSFEEIPGVAMYAYPTNWARDAIFIEERDDYGSDLVKLTGSSWGWQNIGLGHGGGGEYVSPVLNDFAEWLYCGYGFRVWLRKAPNAGIVAISFDGGAETNVDLYSAGGAVPAPLFTKSDLPLDQHRVKLRCTHTKNAGASDYYIIADAIEVMI